MGTKNVWKVFKFCEHDAEFVLFVSEIFAFSLTNDRFSKLATTRHPPLNGPSEIYVRLRVVTKPTGGRERRPRGTPPSEGKRNLEKFNPENIRTDLLSKPIVPPYI